MLRRLALLVLLAFPVAAAETPDLIVVVSVDQLRFDYIDRFAPYLTERGLLRFRRDGAVFPNARFRHSVTFTGPGHAAIGTGLTAAESGIVGNNWFERDAPVDVKRWEWYFDDTTAYEPRKFTPPKPGSEWWRLGGSPRYCVYDDRVQVTAGKTSAMSPVTLDGDALGDRLKERYPDARVLGVAFKDRASILMAGRRADAVYWFDYRLPGFVSSTYYGFNPAVLAFNGQLAGYFPASAQWRLSPFISADEMQRVTFDPPAAWPLKNTRYKGTFPHPIKDMRALTYSGLAHEMLLDFAQHVIATEKLGTRAAPDLLYVGISSFDYIGHYYGPDSMEVADSMLRLDRALGHFLDALERRFSDRVVVVLTSDHGVQDNPEITKLRDPNADAGRIDLRGGHPHATAMSDLPPLRIHLERQLARRLGIPFRLDAPLTDALVYFFEEPSLWLNWRRIAALRLDGERVKRTLRDIIRAMKQHGVADAWTSTEMLVPNPNASQIERLMRASYRSDRAGEVLVALRPGWMWHWGSNSTTHGQPVDDDMHVPLMLYGPGIIPGTYDADVSPMDLAPTLGTLLGVRAGGTAARVLPCVE